MGKIKSFTGLVTWQEAHKLAITVYGTTKVFPPEDRFGLVHQLRRCAVSITSNIAEGFSRYGKKEKRQFYRMALGSLTELQNQMLLARDVGYLPKDNFKKLADSTITVSKLINGLIKSAT